MVAVRGLYAFLIVTCVLVHGPATRADGIRTDANIVTGLDVSGSIEARETQIQIDGMVQALRSPRVASAIQSGRHGRIGFAVFVWANGNQPVFASWLLIGSPEDALIASEELRRRLNAILGSKEAARLGNLTDLSGAMVFGGEMLRSAPYIADRTFLNIIGNGVDNVGEGPELARDALLSLGITINGVVVGHDRGVTGYFRQEVIGGPNAFVLNAADPAKLVEVLERKFTTEIVLNLDRLRPDPPAGQIVR